jgi:hypothetical protein
MRPAGRVRKRIRRAALALVALALVAPAGAVSAEAQSFVTRESAGAASVPSVPARGRMVAGERARYELRLGGREVGTGSLEVVGEEQVNGHRTLHAVLQASGGVLFARVNERFESWIDPQRMFSRRFLKDQKELTKRRYLDYHLSPETKSFRESRDAGPSVMGSTEPLDDVSFLFYARTLPLNVGDVDTIPRYFKPGHDVILRVLRKERITVPAGTFETIVVQPTITNVGGLFGQGGQAEVYFTDDATRTLVQLRTKVPLVGSLSLHLTDFRAAH